MSGTVVVQVWWKKPWKRWSRRTSMDFFMWMKLEDDPSNDSISQNSIWAHPFHLPGYSAESLQDTPWRRGADPCGEVWVEFLFAKPNGFSYGYGSIPINTIFKGINIYLPAISMFTRGTRFWHTAIYNLYNSFLQWSGHTRFFFPCYTGTFGERRSVLRRVCQRTKRDFYLRRWYPPAAPRPGWEKADVQLDCILTKLWNSLLILAPPERQNKLMNIYEYIYIYSVYIYI